MKDDEHSPQPIFREEAEYETDPIQRLLKGVVIWSALSGVVLIKYLKDAIGNPWLWWLWLGVAAPVAVVVILLISRWLLRK